MALLAFCCDFLLDFLWVFLFNKNRAFKSSRHIFDSRFDSEVQRRVPEVATLKYSDIDVSLI